MGNTGLKGLVGCMCWKSRTNSPADCRFTNAQRRFLSSQMNFQHQYLQNKMVCAVLKQVLLYKYFVSLRGPLPHLVAECWKSDFSRFYVWYCIVIRQSQCLLHQVQRPTHCLGPQKRKGVDVRAIREDGSEEEEEGETKQQKSQGQETRSSSGLTPEQERKARANLKRYQILNHVIRNLTM